MRTYEKYVGKTIWSRGHVTKGIITNINYRWCAGCQSNGPVFSVKWEDGRRTFPCPAGCKTNPDGSWEIE